MNLKFYKHGISLMLITSLILLSGCATIVSKTNYPISINSRPSGSKITVNDKKGREIYVGNTPANVMLKSGAGYFSKASYSVTFERDGYQKRIVPIVFRFNGWYVGNIVFGGLIGILIVDPLSGAMWTLDTVFLNESLEKTSASIDTPSLEVYGYNDIPENWKDKLTRINE